MRVKCQTSGEVIVTGASELNFVKQHSWATLPLLPLPAHFDFSTNVARSLTPLLLYNYTYFPDLISFLISAPVFRNEVIAVLSALGRATAGVEP